MSTDSENAFDVATEGDNRVNRMLADTDGSICKMGYNGTIGYHIYVAEGETDPEYLWKIALLQALDETVFEMMYVDAEDPAEATRQVRQELVRSLDPLTAETVAEQFEDNLTSLIEAQETVAETGGDD